MSAGYSRDEILPAKSDHRASCPRIAVNDETDEIGPLVIVPDNRPACGSDAFAAQSGLVGGCPRPHSLSIAPQTTSTARSRKLAGAPERPDMVEELPVSARVRRARRSPVPARSFKGSDAPSAWAASTSLGTSGPLATTSSPTVMRT
jgi:hypothetical protein